MEADQQLAALQQQSQPSHQRDWANGSMGNVQVFHGHHSNGTLNGAAGQAGTLNGAAGQAGTLNGAAGQAGTLNGAAGQDGTGMMTQESPILQDSPPNQARFSGALSHLQINGTKTATIAVDYGLSFGFSTTHDSH